MPFYLYVCRQCGHQFEIRQSYDAPTGMRCPNCEGVAGRKITPVNNTFGWRLTEKSHEPYAKDEIERAV